MGIAWRRREHPPWLDVEILGEGEEEHPALRSQADHEVFVRFGQIESVDFASVRIAVRLHDQ
jgi:hypothetical protein